MSNRGGQPGNQNATHGREFAAALRRVIEKFERPKKGRTSQIAKGQALEALAEKLLKKALHNGYGDLLALQEIANRLDGKCVQPLAGELQIPVTYVFDDPTRRPEGYQRRPLTRNADVH